MTWQISYEAPNGEEAEHTLRQFTMILHEKELDPVIYRNRRRVYIFSEEDKVMEILCLWADNFCFDLTIWRKS
jgi:hypothetical protein